MLVKQVANVLDILEFFAASEQPASLADVSRHFGWPRSSTFNLLSTLVSRGYLYEPEGRGRFYPTPRWLALSQQIASVEPLPEELARLTRDLSASTGETALVAAPSGMHAIFLNVVQSPAEVRYVAHVGDRIPLHATASGQSILSQFPEAQRHSLLRKVVFERYGDGTPMSVEVVEDSIRQSLHRGWFRSASGYSRDLGGVSVPIVLGVRIFSLTVAGPLFRFAEKMPETAAEMHRAIGLQFGPNFLAETVPTLASPPAMR